jgi:1,4-alpha-glucan branching enzyme
LDCEPKGYEWRLQDDADHSILAHERIGDSGERVLVVTNFTPVPYSAFDLGVPNAGRYELILNTDASVYNGSNFDTKSDIETREKESQSLPQSLQLDIPPLATLYYKYIG